MDILAVVKDPGGMNTVLPVVDELKRSGAFVRLVANGKAVELLSAMNIGHVVAFSAEAIIRQFGLPKLFITSMCSGGGVGRDLVPLLRGKAITIAVQDFWGIRLWTDWVDRKFRPDYLLVPDAKAKDIARIAWPDFDPERIHVSGWIAFDKYVDLYPKRAEIADGTRKVLGLLPTKPVILFCGSGNTTGMLLNSVVDALNHFRFDFYFVPRPHPRTKNNYPNEMIPWQEALAKFKKGTLVVDFFDQTDGVSMLAASDVVVSDFSTMLIEAAMLRVPAISLWYPESENLWNFEMKGRVPVFPLISMGCAFKATSPKELASFLRSALSGCEKDDLLRAQAFHFPNTEKSAVRAARFISSLA